MAVTVIWSDGASENVITTKHDEADSYLEDEGTLRVYKDVPRTAVAIYNKFTWMSAVISEQNG